MPIDRDSLRRAANAAAERERGSRPPGIAGLILGLHRGKLAEFVTIESSALPPVPLRPESAVGIAVAARGDSGTWVPWGRVVWSWPEGRVLRQERLSPGVARAIPLASDPETFRQSCTTAEAHLGGDPGAAAELVGHYRRLLGDDGTRLLAAIFPSASDLWASL